MKRSTLDQLAEALLYEGYLLYPYRPSATKNRQRFTFGRVYPEAFSRAQKGAEPCVMQTECIARGAADLFSIEISVKFLHLMAREIHALAPPPQELAGREGHTFNPVPELHVSAKLFQASQEALERRVMPPSLMLEEGRKCRDEYRFLLSAGHTFEPIRDEQDEPAVGVVNRRHEALEGSIEVAAEPVGEKLFKVSVRVCNRTPLRDEHIGDSDAVLMRTFVSTHVVMEARDCEFVSMTDPPPDCKAAVATCKNSGIWPVLVGDEQKRERKTMLSSPIILPDYPKVAAESTGNLFDATEIDEILSLRIMTLADHEKAAMCQADEHARRLLERTQALQEGDWLKMHGKMSRTLSLDEQIFGTNQRLDSIAHHGRVLRAGDKVRIRPKARADAMDMALNGKAAVIETLEQDAEGGVHLAVVLDDDPGKDLGLLRQPGHRFFYRLDEVEPLREGA